MVIKKYGSYKSSDNGYETIFDTGASSYFENNQNEKQEKSALNQQVFNKVLSDNKVKGSDDTGIFRKINAAYRSNTFNQQAIQGLEILDKMQQGDHAFFYDTEILGTATHNQNMKNSLDFYHLTEIAMQKTELKINPETGKREFLPVDSGLSIAIQPTEDDSKKLQGLINEFKNKSWAGMTPDQKRTLADLALYAGDPTKLFSQQVLDGGERIATIHGQSRELRPMDKAIYTKQDYQVFERGLSNLQKNGTAPENLALAVNNYMKNSQNAVLTGYNVYNFDQPMVLDYLNKVEDVKSMGTNSNKRSAVGDLRSMFYHRQVDLYHINNTLIGNAFSTFGQDRKLSTWKQRNPHRMGESVVGNMSHFGLDDVNTNVKMLNHEIFNNKELRHNKGNRNVYSRETLQRGDLLFSFKGQRGSEAGIFDAVFDLNNNNGMSNPVSNYKNSPAIYNQTVYQVGEYYNGIDMTDSKGNKRKQWGIKLLNPEENLAHVIFRDSPEALQQTIQSHMQYIQGGFDEDGELQVADKYKNSIKRSREETATRAYNRIFSAEYSGGVQLGKRMYDIIDEAEALRAEGKTEKQIKNILSHERDGKYRRTDVRNALTMAPRLQAERTLLDPLFDKVSKERGSNESATREIQGRILREFKKLTDDQFGLNTEFLQTYDNQGILNMQLNKQERVLNVKDVEQVRSSLYSLAYDGGNGRPEAPALQNNMRQILSELRKSGVKMNKKTFKAHLEGIKNITNQSSIDTQIAEYSNLVIKAKEKGHLNMANSYETEMVSNLNIKRMQAMNARGGFTGRFEEFFNYVRDEGYKFINNYSEKINFSGDFKSSLELHNKEVQRIYKRMGLQNAERYLPESAEDILKRTIGAYRKQGFEVKLMMDKEKEKYSMFFADKSQAKILGGSFSELAMNSSVGKVDIPLIGKGGMINFGGTAKVNNLFIKKSHHGNIQFSSGFDVAMESIIKGASTARGQIDEALATGKSAREGMERASSIVSSMTKKRIQQLTSNTKYFNNEDKSTAVLIKSNAAKYIRESVVDVTGLAGDWYKTYYNGLSKEERRGKKKPEQILENVQKNYTSIFEELDKDSRNKFQREIDDVVRNNLPGMNYLNAGSIKDTQVINGLRGTVDVRQLLPFGFANPLTRENIQKTVNYESLDTAQLRKQLKLQGKSDAEIQRIIRRRVTTDVGEKVYEEHVGTDKTSFLNVKAAYMDDINIQKRIDDILKELDKRLADPSISFSEKQKVTSYISEIKANKHRFSTYDGVAIVSKDVEKLLDQTRERKMKIGKDSVVSRELEYALKAHLGVKDLDFSKNIDFENVSFNQLREHGLEISDTGKVTMGQLAKETFVANYNGNDGWQTKRSHDPNGSFEKWNIDNTTISHWDAETKTFVMHENITGKSTSKAITDTGGRLTLVGIKQELLDMITGVKGTEMIMPEYEVSKKMKGTQIASFFNTALEETLASKPTMGSVEKEAVMNKVLDHFNRTALGGSQDAAGIVRDGKVIFNSNLGSGINMDISYKDISNFYKAIDADKELQVAGVKPNLMNLGDKDVSVHYVGLGKQAMDDWERGIGFNKKMSNGVLQFGVKETQLLESSFDAGIGGESKYARFIGQYIENANQGQYDDNVSKALIRSAREGHFDTRRGSVVSKDDIILKTTGAEFDADDPFGKTTGRINSNGNYEMGFFGLNENPSKVSHRINEQGVREMVSFTNENYRGTIMDFASKKIDFSDGKSSSDLFSSNNRTALLELPKDTLTGESLFDRTHLRLIDFGSVSRGSKDEVPMFSQIENVQKKLALAIKDYTSIGKVADNSEKSNETMAREKLEKIQGYLNEHDSLLAKQVSSVRDGSIVRNGGYARFDMSGQFRAQPISPFETTTDLGSGSYEVNRNSYYKEGVAYVGKERLLEMVGGAEDNILGLWEKKAQLSGNESVLNSLNGFRDLDAAGKQNLITKHLDTMGLNGTVTRFPSIKEQTTRAVPIRIDPNAEKGYRGIRVGAGLANIIKGDFDGDFYSLNMSHYGRNNFEGGANFDVNRAMDIEKELTTMGSLTKAMAESKGLEVVDDLHKDSQDIQKRFGMSIGEMERVSNQYLHTKEQLDAGVSQEKIGVTTEELNKQAEIHNAFNEKMSSVYNPNQEFETLIARLSKEQVGQIDNERYRMMNLASVTMGALQKEGLIGDSEDHLYTEEQSRKMVKNIEEIGATFSQDSISAKKFDLAKEIDRLTGEGLESGEAEAQAKQNFLDRHKVIQEMTEGLKDLNSDAGRAAVEHGNSVLGLYQGDDIARLHQGLDDLAAIQRLTGQAGGQDNHSLSVGMSEGKSHEVVGKILNAETDNRMVMPTKAMLTLHRESDNQTKQILESSFERFYESVGKTARNYLGTELEIEDQMNRPSHALKNPDVNHPYVGTKNVATSTMEAMSGMVKRNSGLVGSLGIGAGLLGATALVKGGPTPEAMQEQLDNTVDSNSLVQPTARVVQNNGDMVNISIKGRDSNGRIDQSKVMQAIQQELNAMTRTTLDTNLVINDNRGDISTQWVQDVVASAMNK